MAFVPTRKHTANETSQKWQAMPLVCRRLGLPWLSAVDDLTSVRKALAAGLFSNAAQYISTTVESRDKEHTGVDLYQLVRSTSQGHTLSYIVANLCIAHEMYNISRIMFSSLQAKVWRCCTIWRAFASHACVLTNQEALPFTHVRQASACNGAQPHCSMAFDILSNTCRKTCRLILNVKSNASLAPALLVFVPGRSS